jgi:hypothetical protein
MGTRQGERDEEEFALGRRGARIFAAGLDDVGPLPETTRTEMKDKLKGVGQEWAAGLDSRGKQTSAALKEFEGLLAAGGAK